MLSFTLRNNGGNMQSFWQDLRYSARMLVKQPGFTVVAIITLALGIGANTAIFSVVNAVLLRPLPYPAAERLVKMSTNGLNGPDGNTGYTTFVDWRERSKSFEQLAVVRSWGGTLTGQGEPEVIAGMRVSASYFKLLGVAPALGRDFRAEEDRPDTRFVVMLSHALWQRRFNADSNIVGKPLTLSRQTAHAQRDYVHRGGRDASGVRRLSGRELAQACRGVGSTRLRCHTSLGLS
jgi:putative ABC transport system permease protein